MNEERRTQIIRLLETLNDGLPMPTRREHSTSGFVNEPRSRSCPDCIANDRVMKTCPTCGGTGVVEPHRLEAIAATDALPDDGQVRDPYAVSDTVQAYGVRDTRKLGHAPARDAEIDRLQQQLREPFATPEEELEDANRHPFVWERERAAMWKRYDYAALSGALDALRDRHGALAGVVVAVYSRESIVEPSASLEAACELALEFIDARMPDTIRAPGDVKHPALARRDRRAAA